MFIKLYAIALPVLFAIDMIWLGLAAKNFYRQQIGFLMKNDINWAAAIIFYLLFIVWLVIFVIMQASRKVHGCTRFYSARSLDLSLMQPMTLQTWQRLMIGQFW